MNCKASTSTWTMGKRRRHQLLAALIGVFFAACDVSAFTVADKHAHPSKTCTSSFSFLMTNENNAEESTSESTAEASTLSDVNAGDQKKRSALSSSVVGGPASRRPMPWRRPLPTVSKLSFSMHLPEAPVAWRGAGRPKEEGRWRLECMVSGVNTKIPLPQLNGSE